MTRSVSVPASWNVSQRLMDRLAGKVVKQRALAEGKELLLVLHEVPESGNHERESVLYFRDTEGNWHWLPEGKEKSPQGVFDRYEDHLEWLGKLSDEAASAEQYFVVYMKMLPIGIALRNAHFALQSAVDQIPCQADLLDLRDRAQVLEREAEILLNETKAGLEFLNAKKAEQQAELSLQMALQQQRLNWLVALFVPLTLIGSLLGMNLSHGLEGSPPVVFWSIATSGVLLGILLLVFINAGLDSKPGKILKHVSHTPLILRAQMEKLRRKQKGMS
jgi:uncharacterized integral membrane protein